MNKILIKLSIVALVAVFAVPFTGNALEFAAEGDTTTVEGSSDFSPEPDTTTVEGDSGFTPEGDTTTVEGDDEFVPEGDTTTVEGQNNGSNNDSSNNNSGGSSGSSRRNRSNLPSEPTVLGASTGPNGTSLSCAPYMIGFTGIGRSNDPVEVKKLQSFLNEFMSESLPITGFFGPMTDAAVKRLQAKYAIDILKPWDEAGLSVNLQPTGYEYIMTRWFINTEICKFAGVTFPKPDLKVEASK